MTSDLSHCCDKVSNRSNLRKEGLICGLGLRGCNLSCRGRHVGKEVGHRKQKKMCAVSLFIQSLSKGYHLGQVFPSQFASLETPS